MFFFFPNILCSLLLFTCTSAKVDCHQSAGFVSVLGEGNGVDSNDTDYFYHMGNALAYLYPKYLGIFSISSVRLASYHSTGML